MQLAVERKAYLALVQEPPTVHTYSQQGFNIVWQGRTATAIRKGQVWTASLLSSPAKNTGDVQVLQVDWPKVRTQQDRGKGVSVRIANINSAPILSAPSWGRPCEEADRDDILGEGKCTVAGDFNSHSKRRDPQVDREAGGGAAQWTIQLIQDHDLHVYNDGNIPSRWEKIPVGY